MKNSHIRVRKEKTGLASGINDLQTGKVSLLFNFSG
jgi:hypothetical protein